MNKQNALNEVLEAARDRADYLEKLAFECSNYRERKDFKDKADNIRLACAELDRS
jgi:hypothetical protein